jgi:hypothetical protein
MGTKHYGGHSGELSDDDIEQIVEEAAAIPWHDKGVAKARLERIEREYPKHYKAALKVFQGKGTWEEAIIQKCLDCSLMNTHNVLSCQSCDCPLWGYKNRLFVPPASAVKKVEPPPAPLDDLETLADKMCARLTKIKESKDRYRQRKQLILEEGIIDNPIITEPKPAKHILDKERRDKYNAKKREERRVLRESTAESPVITEVVTKPVKRTRTREQMDRRNAVRREQRATIKLEGETL